MKYKDSEQEADHDSCHLTFCFIMNLRNIDHIKDLILRSDNDQVSVQIVLPLPLSAYRVTLCGVFHLECGTLFMKKMTWIEFFSSSLWVL